MRRWLALGGIVGAVIAGCSSSADQFPDVNTFCLARAQAECQNVATACGVSSQACTSVRQQACVTAASAATASGTRAFAPGNASACIGAISQTYAAGVSSVSYTNLQVLNYACDQGVFPGTVPLMMGSCKTSADCALAADGMTQLVCSPVNPGSKLLECANPVNVTAAGQPCANFGSVCPAGTYCLGSTNVPYTCEAGGGVGASCTPQRGCGAGAYCNISPGANEGSCLAVTNQSGTGCTSDVSCGGGGPLGSTPTTNAPYCDPNVPPMVGTGTGACEAGQSFAIGSDDCKAFGLATQ